MVLYTGAMIGQIWIGATDAVDEGVFRWTSDESAISFENFQPGEPDNHLERQHCVVMKEVTGKWFDRQCVGSVMFVCQWEA